MDLNTDVICNYSGEILMEGVLLASAHIYVAKKGGKIIKDEVQSYDLDEIDGGGQITVRNLFVEIPEVIAYYDEESERHRKASEFWKYNESPKFAAKTKRAI